MPVKIHPTVTLNRVIQLVQLANRTTENPGLCLSCGEEAMGIEPDLEHGVCESCGRHQVYGAPQILICFNLK